MKSIEFRAWGERKLEFSGELSLRMDSLIESIDLDRYVLVQYTRLLDKKGTKIFKGDIIKCVGHAGQVYINTVEFYRGGFTGAPYSGDMQVIGNIYENQELLEIT